ncbi:MAG: dihydrofolate reductase [Verrucomicrobia bacterium]|nr:dihydrofolate reductase [Verrucomicrobiota bacterium]
MKAFKAVAAMARNRVIGRAGRIPWRLPEDFRWFKQLTTGHVLVMGRRTFESIGKPLPHRETIVLSRSGFSRPDVRTVRSLEEIPLANDPRDFFICGGAEVYRAALPYCSDLYLTLVHMEPEGDTFFPPFEELFALRETLRETDRFTILRYVNPRPLPLRASGEA